jgi:hypothetical protein
MRKERFKGMKIHKPKRVKLKMRGCKLLRCVLSKEQRRKTRPLRLNRTKQQSRRHYLLNNTPVRPKLSRLGLPCKSAMKNNISEDAGEQYK